MLKVKHQLLIVHEVYNSVDIYHIHFTYIFCNFYITKLIL